MVRGDDRAASGSEHPPQLDEAAGRVEQVLDHLSAEHDVEAPVGVGQGLEVGAHGLDLEPGLESRGEFLEKLPFPRADFDDAVPVPCEPFTMWVLEDDFAGPRPAWEAVGAIFTDQVHGYELVKLRLLNATNSLLAYLGILTEKTYQAEAAQHPAIRRVAGRLGDEMQPTIDLPDGLDPKAYREEMFSRFDNLELRHTCRQVGSDGSAKLTQRVPGPVAWHAAHGQVPPVIALLVAAWLHVTTRLDLPTNRMSDEPMRDRLRELEREIARPTDLARAALAQEAMLGLDLARREAFIALVGEYLDQIAAGRLPELLARLGTVNTAGKGMQS